MFLMMYNQQVQDNSIDEITQAFKASVSSFYEDKIKRQEETIAHLIEEVKKRDDAILYMAQTYKNEVSELERIIDKKNELITNAQKDKMSYEEIVRERDDLFSRMGELDKHYCEQFGRTEAIQKENDALKQIIINLENELSKLRKTPVLTEEEVAFFQELVKKHS